MLLANFLDARTICFERRVLSREQVYRDLISRISHLHHHVLPQNDQPLLDAVLERESESSMAYPTGIAIPHIRIEGLEDTVTGICFLQNPLDYDGIKVNWVVMIFTDKSSSKVYLNLVAALLKLSKDRTTMDHLHSLNDGHSVIQHLKQLQTKVKEDLCIRDIMVTDIISVRDTDTLKTINRLFNEHKISWVPVLDEQGRYLGEANIITVLRVGVPNYLMMMDNVAFLQSFEPLENLFEQEEIVTARDVMIPNAEALSPEASVIEAVVKMIQQQKRFFTVVENGRPVGIVTSMDIFRKVFKA